tara:strand:+ start:138 stop:548 length:411 start_codon:yes stop_codon:yes gene_type:complete
MGTLFIFTLFTIFFLFIAFLRNYQNIGEPIPHWYMIVHSIEILLYLLYFALRRYIIFSRNGGFFLLFLLHDICLIALMMLISDVKSYLYISMTMLYYIFFFGVIVCKKTLWGEEEDIQRSSLPRKTFIEMVEFNNE